MSVVVLCTRPVVVVLVVAHLLPQLNHPQQEEEQIQ
jgi:hypothetical protein